MCDTCLDQKIIIGADGRPKRCPACAVPLPMGGARGGHTAPALAKASARMSTPAAPGRVSRYDPREAQAKLAEFNDFMRQHPRIYAMFEQAALDRLAAGKTRVGAKDIFEDMRGGVGHTGGKYDLDNTWAPWLARKAILNHPELNAVIETRASLADILLHTAKAEVMA